MIRKRILGLLIVLTMIAAAMPQFALAEDTENTEPSAIITEDAGAEEAVPGEGAGEETGGAVEEAAAKEANPEVNEDITEETGETTENRRSAGDSGTEKNGEPADDVRKADDDEPVDDRESADGFQMTLPTVYLHINGGQAEVDKMNGSEDHSYHCKGTMDIVVPDGFSYVDSDAPLSSVTGLGMDIRGRGNTSWMDEKKPYKIKLNEKTKILGMGKNRHWALIANAYDPSLMRNRITYWLGKELGLEFTPSGYPVDVFMEGEYIGSYLLCETMRVDKNRVEIDELDESVTGGRELTGGYFVQFMQDPERVSVFTTEKCLGLQNVDPNFDPDDDGYESEAQMNYIRGYIQEAEDAMFEGETADDSAASGYRELNYRDYIDIDSAALYWLCQEVSLNSDSYRTGSTYFYKKRDKEGEPGKIFWGPLWDFDYAWDYGDSYEGTEEEPFQTDTEWMTAMMTDRSPGGLADTIKADWPLMKEKLEYIVEPGGLLDQYREEVRASEAYDQEKYNRVGDDGEYINYDNAVEHLRTWIKNRIKYVDENIGTLDEFSYKASFKQDRNDEHPVVFAYKKGFGIRCDLEEPQKEGYIFLGWFTEDGINKEDARLNSDMTFYQKFIREEDASKVEDIYFARDEAYAELSDEVFMPQITTFPDDAQDLRVAWTSSDKSVASVQGDGTVDLHRTGTVTITATAPNGNSRSYKLHVVDEMSNIESASVRRKVIYMKPGDIRKIIVDPTPADSWYFASFQTESEGESVVSVEQTGVVIARSAGRERVQINIDYNDDGGWSNMELFCDIIVSEKDGTLTTDTVTDGIEGKAVNLDKIARDILSEEDAADLNGGADIKVWLSMKRLGDSEVPAGDRQKLADHAAENGLTEGCCLDTSLFKRIGDYTEALHSVSKPVRFSVTVPEDLRNTDPDVDRTFYLLHAGGGGVSVTASGTDDKLEGESSSFSTYMIAYADKETGDDQTAEGNGGRHGSRRGVNTGDSRNIWLWTGIMLVSFAALAFMIMWMKRRRK